MLTAHREVPNGSIALDPKTKARIINDPRSNVEYSSRSLDSSTTSKDEGPLVLNDHYDIKPVHVRRKRNDLTGTPSPTSPNSTKIWNKSDSALEFPGSNQTPDSPNFPLDSRLASTNVSLGSQLEGSYDAYKFAENRLFDFIDREQFENYLKEPEYIKIHGKSKSSAPFRRLFLAQELKIPALRRPSILTKKDPNSTNNTSFSDSGKEKSDKAIWATKFSKDGKYMATASKDGFIRIWKVISSPMERWELDSTLESDHVNRANSLRLKTSLETNGSKKDKKNSEESDLLNLDDGLEELYAPVFMPKPVAEFAGHDQDIFDIDWSRNNFIVSSSMDKTVKIWHLDKSTALKTFDHPDFVTCVMFHPTDDRFIISGCLDHKCRVWSILESKVIFEFQCHDLITSLALSPDEGQYTIIGTFNGYIHLLLTRGLRHIITFHITDKNTNHLTYDKLQSLDTNKLKHGPRVTGLSCFKNEKTICLSVTSDDSRIRIFDLHQRKLVEVLKGFHQAPSQHSCGVFSFDGPLVLCGSDDHMIYGWRLQSHESSLNEKQDLQSVPKPESRTHGIKKFINKSVNTITNKNKENQNSKTFGTLMNLPLKNQHLKNKDYVSFRAHNGQVTSVTLVPQDTCKTIALSDDPICELSMEFFGSGTGLDALLREQRENKSNSSDSLLKSKSTSKCIPKVTVSASNLAPCGSPRRARQNSNVMTSDLHNAIGLILVSTDTEGVIRVFRADMPKEIRSLVLKTLHNYNATSADIQNYEQPFKSSNIRSQQDGLDSRLASSGYDPISLPTPLFDNDKTKESRSPYITGVINRRKHSSIPNNNSATSLSPVLDPPAPSHNITHMTTQNASGSTVHERNSIPGRTGSINPVSLSCDMCKGTKIGPLSRSKPNTRDKGYICLECGTLVNKFR